MRITDFNWIFTQHGLSCVDWLHRLMQFGTTRSDLLSWSSHIHNQLHSRSVCVRLNEWERDESVTDGGVLIGTCFDYRALMDKLTEEEYICNS